MISTVSVITRTKTSRSRTALRCLTQRTSSLRLTEQRLNSNVRSSARTLDAAKSHGFAKNIKIFGTRLRKNRRLPGCLMALTIGARTTYRKGDDAMYYQIKLWSGVGALLNQPVLVEAGD